MRIVPTCENCDFFCPAQMGERNPGHCRLHPPIYGNNYQFPRVNPTEFCADGQAFGLSYRQLLARKHAEETCNEDIALEKNEEPAPKRTPASEEKPPAE